MNKCKVCDIYTNNDNYCSMKCRDSSRKSKSWIVKKCKVCESVFECRVSRIKIYCSCKCASNDKYITIKKNEKAKETNIKKYGCHPSKTDLVKEKIKNSLIEKYGVDHYSKTEDYKTKVKSTNLKKYNVEYPQQNELIKEKTKIKVNEKYGGFTLKSKKLSEKVKSTILEKYGVDNVQKNENIKNKKENTNLKKYGFKSPLKNESIKSKIKDTLFKKYNVTNISQDFNTRCKISATIHKKFYEYLINEKLKNICKPLFSTEEYTGVEYYKKYPFECIKCNNVFSDYLYGGRIPKCQICYPFIQSKPQKEVYDFVRDILPKNIEIIENTKKILPSGKELDIYIPSKNIAIEFDGLYWHSEINGQKNKNYHLDKTEECEKLGIKCIHIFENEWTLKNDIIKRKISYMLKTKSNKGIYARNCIIKEIDENEKRLFLDKYHIQGNDKSKIKLGAFYQNELVSVMTFSKQRLALGNKISIDGEYELIRFCVGNENVIGIGGKLLSYFIRKYDPIKIVSYADRRYSDSKSFYQKIGFNFVGVTNPNYWYFLTDNYLNLTHRFNFRKNILHKKLEKFDENMTEWQNMQINGYDRIWDCGHLKYEWLIGIKN